jgi:hypothetical protein
MVRGFHPRFVALKKSIALLHQIRRRSDDEGELELPMIGHTVLLG